MPKTKTESTKLQPLAQVLRGAVDEYRQRLSSVPVTDGVSLLGMQLAADEAVAQLDEIERDQQRQADAWAAGGEHPDLDTWEDTGDIAKVLAMFFFRWAVSLGMEPKEETSGEHRS